MNKYIIKNCPMYFHSNCYGHTGNCNCQDCTDCVMKQIAELCSFNYTKENTNLLAKEILKHLNIQEVE